MSGRPPEAGPDEYDRMSRDELLIRALDWRRVANERSAELARMIGAPGSWSAPEPPRTHVPYMWDDELNAWLPICAQCGDGPLVGDTLDQGECGECL